MVMSEKSQVDRLRESGGMMEIGTADDSSAITAMLSLGDILYTIKENGIYAIKLADSIDPKRINPNIPNVQQRVLNYGSEFQIVGQTLLTARKLFNESFLPKSFDCTRAITLSLDALKDIVAMYEEMKAFQLSEDTEKVAFDNRQQKNGSLIMPAIGNVKARCMNFYQKADHASQSLFSIVKMFYEKEVGAGGFESLAKVVVQKYGKDDSFAKFAIDVAPRLKCIRNIRNCLEHPNPPNQIANVRDFDLGSDGVISPPMIEARYRGEHYPMMPISWFMTDTVDGLSGVFENMIAFLCSKHVQQIGGFQAEVIEMLPEWKQRENIHVRFSYGIQMNGQIVPAG